MEITFEHATEPQTFAHIRSHSGILGHAQEIRDRVPVGTWLMLQPELDRVAGWLIRKCGFRFHGIVRAEHEWQTLLRREN